MNRVVLYARVSSDDSRKDGRNLAGQLDMGQEYAQKHGYTAIAELAEDDRGASGAAFELPQLNRIREMAGNHEIDVLVVREIDRLSRNLVKQLLVEEELKRAGVRIEYVLGEYPDNPEGNLMKHVRECGRIRAREDQRAHDTGAPAEGEERQRDDTRACSLWVPEDRRERQIRAGNHRGTGPRDPAHVTWYALGDGESEPLSLDRIKEARRFERPAQSHDIDQRMPKLRGPGKWSRAVVRKMLLNETYAGLWHYGKHAKDLTEDLTVTYRRSWAGNYGKPCKTAWRATAGLLRKDPAVRPPDASSHGVRRLPCQHGERISSGQR